MDISFLVRVREAGVSVNKTFKIKKGAEKHIRDINRQLGRGKSVDIATVKRMTLGILFDDYLKYNNVADGKRYVLQKLKIEIGKMPLQLFKAGAFAVYPNAKLTQSIPDHATKKGPSFV